MKKTVLLAMIFAMAARPATQHQGSVVRNQIPEPRTLALASIGLLITGLAMRRRSR